jgi:hypothetical protein
MRCPARMGDTDRMAGRGMGMHAHQIN